MQKKPAKLQPGGADLPVTPIAGSLFADIRQLRSSLFPPINLNPEFISMPEDDRVLWIKYSAEIPSKLNSLNIRIRPYSDYCRTCLIDDSDIARLAESDYNYFRRIYKNSKPKKPDWQYETWPASFDRLPEKKRKFFYELNYLVPAQLKKAGYEIIRKEEAEGIDDRTVKKIARAIHSRYLNEIRKQSTSLKRGAKTAANNLTDFDNLPGEIKFSNIDNAAHIPAKLLAIGYKIRPVKKGNKPFALHLSPREIETMAALEHLRWSWDKRLNGWIYGKTRNDIAKTHPGLIPYKDLPENEKEKDRELVKLIPGLLQDISFEACPINPGRIKALSYAIKPHSSIHIILDEIRELNDQLRKKAVITPEMEVMIGVRNKKIQEAINEIEGSYKYARHIQETFLPDDLYIRECFPDNFVLYKPRDIVSGDFYFFSKRDQLIIFAAADCTGHGIPGALISTIGYGTLDQAVNQLGITNPSDILTHLYSRIHRFMKTGTGDEGLPDDMDIVLCVLDADANSLTYSSVNNPFYHVKAGKIKELKANNMRGGCGEEGDCMFATGTIKVEPGDILYLFSDGFADQFGGKYHKKYQRSRFMEFIGSIRKHSMPEQSDLLYEEFERWREENNEDQTDDIMVIGIRL